MRSEGAVSQPAWNSHRAVKMPNSGTSGAVVTSSSRNSRVEVSAQCRSSTNSTTGPARVIAVVSSTNSCMVRVRRRAADSSSAGYRSSTGTESSEASSTIASGSTSPTPAIPSRNLSNRSAEVWTWPKPNLRLTSSITGWNGLLLLGGVQRMLTRSARLELHLLAKQPCKTGLAHSWIAAQQDEAAMPGAAVLPRLLEDRPLPFAANKRGQQADHLNAFSRGALVPDQPQRYRIRHALEPPLTKTLADEVALNDLPGDAADEKGVRLRF
jgi:hypothetical protein